MSQTRHRPSPLASASPPGEASLAPLLPAASLVELREAMGSPGVIQAEVDALLAALARPLTEDETPRARADFLLSLLELPAEAGERTGSSGRTVRAAAVEALMELGFPYALEVPPEVLESVRREEPGHRDGRKSAESETPGMVVTVLATLAQLFLLAVISFRISGPYSKAFLLLLLGLVLVPPVLATAGLGLRQRAVQRVGARAMLVQGVAWLGFTLLTSWQANASALLLLPWYLPLLAGYLMSPKKPS